eukprot:1075914-Amphidinium_carterae.1
MSRWSVSHTCGCESLNLAVREITANYWNIYLALSIWVQFNKHITLYHGSCSEPSCGTCAS